MWMCCLFLTDEKKYVPNLDVFFFRQYKTCLRRIEDRVRVCLQDSGTKLQNENAFGGMWSARGVSFHQHASLCLEKPGYAVHKTFDAFVNTIAVLQLWIGDMFRWCMYHFCFTRCSYCTRFYCIEHFITNPHLYLTVTMTMTCNNMSISCATMIFAIVLMTFNNHFQNNKFILFQFISLRPYDTGL
jgi:hypothetical protein